MYNVAAISKETDTDNWKLIPLLNITSMYKLLFDKTKVQRTSRVGTKLQNIKISCEKNLAHGIQNVTPNMLLCVNFKTSADGHLW